MSLTNIAKGVPPVDWISPSSWQQCKYLAWKMNEFQNLCLSIVNRPDQWAEFQKSNDVFTLLSVPYEPSARYGDRTIYKSMIIHVTMV